MASVSQVWSEINAWLSTHLPASLDNLRQGASQEELAATEQALGLKFPEALKELYLLNDGETNNWPPGVFDDGHWFMPLSEMVEFRQNLMEFQVPEDMDSMMAWRRSVEDGVIFVKGPVKPKVISHRWIPLTSSNGDVHRYIDLDPAPGGQSGQVIEIYPEACTHQVLAPSLEAYLEHYLEGLKGNRYQIADDTIEVVDDGVVETDWGIPEYLQQVEVESVRLSDISKPIGASTLDPEESLTLTGQVVFLTGGVGEIDFSLLVRDGVEYSIKATPTGTRGYDAIAIREFVVITLKPNTHPSELTEWAGAESPQFFAIRCKPVRALGVKLKRRPWWKFW